MKKLVFTLIIGIFLCSELCAEVITLQGGASVSGEVLAQKDKDIVVDLGYTVLQIPRDKIERMETESDANNPKAVMTSAEPNVMPAALLMPAETAVGLYYVGTNQKSSIEECVEKYSEAVVLVSTPAGLGSGFFINEDGYLITNYHVIEQETKIEVTVFQKGKVGFDRKNFKQVRIEALNQFVDLALLKVEDLKGYKTKFVNLGSVDNLKVGETVFAIGNPLGLERTTTSGIVSTKNRGFEGLVYIQTNADINPGNSGGPLFNLAGEVVGVTNMGYIFFGGLGFAIPVDYVKHFVKYREAFAYDKDNANTGFRYVQPAKRINKPSQAKAANAKK